MDCSYEYAPLVGRALPGVSSVHPLGAAGPSISSVQLVQFDDSEGRKGSRRALRHSSRSTASTERFHHSHRCPTSHSVDVISDASGPSPKASAKGVTVTSYIDPWARPSRSTHPPCESGPHGQSVCCRCCLALSSFWASQWAQRRPSHITLTVLIWSKMSAAPRKAAVEAIGMISRTLTRYSSTQPSSGGCANQRRIILSRVRRSCDLDADKRA